MKIRIVTYNCLRIITTNKMCLKKLLIFVLFGAAVSTTYHGYKVYKVTTTTETENAFLLQMAQNQQFDFWSSINKIGNPVTVMVAPQAQQEFEQELVGRRIQHEVEIADVQRTIDLEQEYHKSKTPLNGKITFDQYLRYEDITAYLVELSTNYPNLVTISSIGHSYENRTMNIIHISNGTGPKPILLIEAGMHAREWISPALALYIINQLVEDETNLDLLTSLDWVILPCMNPDGYEYTWTTDRVWRKTRSPGTECDGTDGNRNFGFHWMGLGASDQECNQMYAGTSAFSEMECANLRDFFNATENIVGYVSLHSYGQLLFYPYSYDFDVAAENWQELDDLAHRADDAIYAVNGSRYYIGAGSDILYTAAGCSDDWAMGAAGIETVLTFMLPGGGTNGYDMYPDHILTVVNETWPGIKVIGEYLAQKVK